MHIQKYFQVNDPTTINEFIKKNNFGELISNVEGRLFATHIPFLYHVSRKTLTCHIARSNPQWREIENQQVMVTFQGPHGYVSPSWYTDPGVPTWNYQAVHVYGTCRVLDDDDVIDVVTELTAIHESRFENPWSIEYDPALLKAIVGLKIDITEIQCKFKLSQNRSAEDRRGVIENLENQRLVEEMKRNSL